MALVVQAPTGPLCSSSLHPHYPIDNSVMIEFETDAEYSRWGLSNTLYAVALVSFWARDKI